MDFAKNVLNLRPADDSPAAVAAALDQARRTGEEVTAALNAATARRNGLLLDGSPDQLEAAEAELRIIREQVERVGAMEALLTTRHAEAQRAEVEGAVQRDKDAVEAASKALADWWDKQLTKLRAMEAEGTRLHVAHDAAMNAWRMSMQTATQGAPAGYTAPIPKETDIASPRHFLRVTHDLLTLIEQRAAS